MNPVIHSIFALILSLGPPGEAPSTDGPPSYDRALEQLGYGVTIGDEQPKEAISILEGALAVLPQFTPQLANDPEALALRAEAYVSLARAYLTVRDEAKASAALEEGIRAAPFGQDLPATVYGPRVEKLWKQKIKEVEGLPRREVVVHCWVQCHIYLNERIVAGVDASDSSSGDEFATQARFEVLSVGSHRLWIEAADTSTEPLIVEFGPSEPGDPPLDFIFGTEPEPEEPTLEGPALAPVKQPAPVEPRRDRPKRLLPRPVEMSAMIAGVGLIVSGAVLFAMHGKCASDAESKDAVPADGTEICPSLWTTNVAGLALLGSGAGLAAAGSILIGIDEVRAAKDQRAARITVGWKFSF